MSPLRFILVCILVVFVVAPARAQEEASGLAETLDWLDHQLASYIVEATEVRRDYAFLPSLTSRVIRTLQLASPIDADGDRERYDCNVALGEQKDHIPMFIRFRWTWSPEEESTIYLDLGQVDSVRIEQVDTVWDDPYQRIVFSSRDGDIGFRAVTEDLEAQTDPVTSYRDSVWLNIRSSAHAADSIRAAFVQTIGRCSEHRWLLDEGILNPAYFDYTDAGVDKELLAGMEENVEVLQSYPDFCVHIDGYVNVEEAQEVDAADLSEQRALTIRDILAARGVAAGRLFPRGRGRHPDSRRDIYSEGGSFAARFTELTPVLCEDVRTD